MYFPVWMNPEGSDIFTASINKGLEKSGRARSDFNVAPFVTAIMGDDVAACRFPVKSMVFLYIGDMGAKSKNFYKDYPTALGYEEAEQIQELYLAGKKTETSAVVPDALIDDIALLGPKERIVERLQA